jgi:hypothetical protein
MSYTSIEGKALKFTSEFQVLKLLQEYRDHTDDPWLRLVMKRAVQIVCENKIFEANGYTIKIKKEFENKELRTALQDDMTTMRLTPDEYASGNIFPLKNHTLVTHDDDKCKIQGNQFADYIVILEGDHINGTQKQFSMVFEGEAHKKDQGKRKVGMFLYQKMFQDAAFCQDINPNVPAIFIALAMRACEEKGPSGKNQTFPQWTRALLESCVLLFTRLCMYTLDILPKNDFISEQLGKINTRDKAPRTYDLYCWINVEYTDKNNLIEFNARTCFEEFSSTEIDILNDGNVDVDEVDADAKKDHKDEFINLLKYNKSVTGEWPLPNESSEHTFYAKKIKFVRKQMPVTILAVERATNSVEKNKDIDASASIDQIKNRIKRLTKRSNDLDSTLQAGGLTNAEEKELEDEIENIALEIERLHEALTKLQGRGKVTLSRGMWYPRHVLDILRGRTKNRRIRRLTPLCNFMSLLQIPRLDFENFGDTKADTIIHEDVNLDDHKGHICLTLPWLWTNIGFLYMMNKKVNYEWRKPGILVKLAEDFRRDGMQNWRGGAGNEVEVKTFPTQSNTLFARLCKQMSKETHTVKLDDAFQTFLFETCGWERCNEAQSPAMFFRLLGVSSVKTGCLISSTMVKTPNARFDSIKKSFPLNAQVEIDYAVAALAATIYHTEPA